MTEMGGGGIFLFICCHPMTMILQFSPPPTLNRKQYPEPHPNISLLGPSDRESKQQTLTDPFSNSSSLEIKAS